MLVAIRKHFFLAWRSIRRSPGTTLVMSLTIACGVGVSMSLLAFYAGMNADPLPRTGDVTYRVLLDNWGPNEAFAPPDRLPVALTYQDSQALMESAEFLQAAMFHSEARVATQDGRTFVQPLKASTRATTAGFFELFEPPFLYGQGWSGQAADEKPAVIGRALNDRLFGGENSVGRSFLINDEPFTVVGVVDGWAPYPLFYDMTRQDVTFDDLFVPFDVAIETLQLTPSFARSPLESGGGGYTERFTRGETVFVQHWAHLPDAAAYRAFSQRLEGYLSQQRALGRFPRPLRGELKNVDDWIAGQEWLVVQQTSVMTLVIVGVLFFFVCLTNIVTLLMSRFLGQSRSIGILRAIGAPLRILYAQHLMEAGIIGIAGSLLGLGLARAALSIVGPLFLGPDAAAQGADGSEFGSLIDGQMLLIGITVGVLGSIIVAVIPTIRVCRASVAQHLTA